MGTPRNNLVVALLLLSLMAGFATAEVPGQMTDSSSIDLAGKALLSPEKGLSDSGYEYFVMTNFGLYNFYQGAWRNWPEEYWNEWAFGRHMWGYDFDHLHFSTDSEYTYHWDGESWNYYRIPGVDYGGSIVGFGPDNVYTVGRNSVGSSLCEWRSDDGHYWNTVQNLGPYAITEMWGLTGDNLFFGGFNGALLQYDGATVHELSLGMFGRISSMWGTGAANIYMIGDGNGLLHWNGQDLALVELPAGFVSSDLRNVWGSGPNDVWAVGINGKIVHFNGSAWTDESLADTALQFNSVWGSGPNDVWATGNGGAAHHWDGSEWTYQTDLGNREDNQFLGVFGLQMNDGDENWVPGFGNPDSGGLGFNGYVWNILEHDNGVVAVGNFSKAGQDTANYIAKFNGTSWEPLYNSTGPNGEMRDVIEYDGQLVAAGIFWSMDGDTINAVAAWDGTQWSPLGDGIVPRSDSYYSTRRLLEMDGNLYVLGTPEVTAMWDGTTWTRLDGFTGELWAAAVYDGNLYAGGNTGSPGSGVLRLNGTTWERVGNNDFSGWIYTMEVFGNDLFVGGDYTITGLDYRYLTRWTGVAFSQVADITGSFITCLSDQGDKLFVGGNYRLVDGQRMNGAAFWSESGGWQRMGSGINSWAWSTLVRNEMLWISGEFRSAGNRASYGLARWKEAPVVLDGPPVTVAEPAMPGTDFTLGVNLRGNPGEDPVLAHYRLRDGDPWQVSRLYPTVDKDGLFEGTIPGNFFDDLGFQYFVTGGSGDTEFVFPAGDPADPLFQPAWTGVTMTNFSFTTPAAQTYTLMGVPFVPNQSTGAILTGAMGAYDNSKWRFGRWDPSTSRYLEYPNTPGFAPGVGYWLIQKSPREIPVNGVSTSTFGGVSIALRPGWNMIATPYNFPIAWSDVTLGPNIENRLVARSGGTYVDVAVMNPWQGYWVLNTGLNDETINIPPTMVPVKSELEWTPKDQVEPADLLWSINVAASYGDRSDVQNVAAIATQAEDGVDRMDYHEPPAMPGDVSWTFEVEQGDRMHSLSTDVRSEFTTGQAWDAVLRLEGGGRVQLDFSGVGQVPAEYTVALLTETGRIDLRQSGTATVTVGAGGEARLRLAVGDVQYVAEQEQNLPRPFALRANYPNPFNPRTKVAFTLPRTARVLVEIYDIRGRKVRTLVDDQFEAGLHEIDWLGRDDGGRSVSTGVYFSRMRADGFEQTRKMTLVR